jgi:hypothetical protein
MTRTLARPFIPSKYLHPRALLCASILASANVSQAQDATPAPSAPGPSTAPANTKPAASPSPIKLGEYTVSGSVRARYENWSWFDTPGFNDSYGFTGALARVGISKTSPRLDTTAELAIPVLAGLPDNAVAPASRGALGLGANYRAANGGQDASIFPKQLFARFKGNDGLSLRLGRFDWVDGSEIAPKNPALVALKRDRIAHRLLGNFGFSHMGRSYDGLQIQKADANRVLHLSLMRPTEGVFQLNGLGEVKGVDVAYASVSGIRTNDDWRVFGSFYRDDRTAPLSTKADNRPAALRTGDREDIAVGTVGAHYLKTIKQVDLLAWGALQGGDWGTQSHRAGAFALEAGYQLPNSKLKPWLRVGWNKSTGDGDSTDGRHETFFAMLPTPRIYARTPFYNSMNNDDVFASLILRPSPKLSVRADARRLRLSDADDLWYSGGGAFQDGSFGFAGRPSGGSKSLGNLFDISLDYAISPVSSVGLYFGHVAGGRVVSNIYAGDSLNYAYAEFTQRF